MAQQRNLVVTGVSAGAAGAIQGRVANSLTAAGSTQATATPLPADINVFTTVGSGQGALLPSMSAGDSINIFNKQATNALLVYPPTGGLINSLSTNAGYSVAVATPFCEVYCVDALTYIASQSA